MSPNSAFSIVQNQPSTLRRIGLTGGIGTGKTTVSRYLAKTYQLPILDADIYARNAVKPGSPILKRIADRYGAEILLANGTLNRRYLGQLIFNDAAERQWLEQQIHPYVREAFAQEIARFERIGEEENERESRGERKDASESAVSSPDGIAAPIPRTIVLAIPLLFETGMTERVTETWVVYCSPTQQLERVMQRDRISPEAAQSRIASQMPLTEKVALADIVLDNSSNLERLLQQVDSALGMRI